MKYLYHQTSTKVIWKILNEGLKARIPDEWKQLLIGQVPASTPVIWFTDTIREKGSYLHPSKCLVRVDISKLDPVRLIHINKTAVKGWWVYMGDIRKEACERLPWWWYRRKQPRWWIRSC